VELTARDVQLHLSVRGRAPHDASRAMCRSDRDKSRGNAGKPMITRFKAAAAFPLQDRTDIARVR